MTKSMGGIRYLSLRAAMGARLAKSFVLSRQLRLWMRMVNAILRITMQSVLIVAYVKPFVIRMRFSFPSVRKMDHVLLRHVRLKQETVLSARIQFQFRKMVYV